MAKAYMYRNHGIWVENAKAVGEVGYCSIWYTEQLQPRRVFIRELPIRKTKVTAQKDLDRFAETRKLKVITE
ncbi:MAG: hypothetical protein RR203_07885 [Synergistaceae bacterium]